MLISIIVFLMDTLNSDIIKYVLPHFLEIKDLYNFGLTNKYYFDCYKLIIHQKIISNIINKLKIIFQDHYDNIIKLMQENNSIISGSFIIQCILDEEWVSDIDIYEQDTYYGTKCNVHNETILNEYLNKHYKSECFTTRSLYDDISSNQIKIHISEYNNHNKNKNKINKIQLIHLNVKEHDDVKIFIDTTFDFDICKNIFYFENNKPHLFIKSLSDIINKQTDFKFKFGLFSSIARMIKYTKRGFYFDISNFTYNDYVERTSIYIQDTDFKSLMIFNLQKLTNNIFKLINGDLEKFIKLSETQVQHIVRFDRFNNPKLIKKYERYRGIKLKVLNNNIIQINDKFKICDYLECEATLLNPNKQSKHSHFRVCNIGDHTRHSKYIIFFS